MTRSVRLLVLTVALFALGVSQVAAGGGAEATDGPVTIEFMLWGAPQLPAYQAVADRFMELNPDITIDMVQMGWGDYWSDLTRRFAVNDGPDVFWNHVANFRDLATRGQLMPLDSLVEESDMIDTDAYLDGLYGLFSLDGVTYGLPKDWDTIAIVYNRAFLEEAGVDPADLENLTWNPDDGGTWEELIARLSIDAHGNNGLSPDFDPDDVVRYGFVHDDLDAWGQSQFAHYSASMGWDYHDGTARHYNYDHPDFVSMIEWFYSLTERGFAVPQQDVDSKGDLIAAQLAAMTTDGSWRINFYNTTLGEDAGFAPLPIGPNGRYSMLNGLAESIWSGTEHPEEAIRWVEFLASAEAQEIVAEFAIVFPAVESATEMTLDVHEGRGADVSAFTRYFEDGDTILFPIVPSSLEISRIMSDAFDRIWLTGVDVATELERANAEVNALFD